MSTWRDNMRPSSFRGVAFEVTSRGGETGRRGPNHEYPDRDEGFVEDTGKKLRTYKVEAFLLASRLGGDYMAARDKLLAALEQKGPGEYIDAWGDSWLVQVRSASWSESTANGGTVSFSISFVEYSPVSPHTVTEDTAYQVGQAAVTAQNAVVAAASAAVNTRGNGNVVSRAMDNGVAILDAAEAAVVAVRASIDDAVARVSSNLNAIAALRVVMGSLVQDASFVATLAGILSQSLQTEDDAASRYRAALAVLDYGSDFSAISSDTPTLAQAAANQAALVAMVHAQALIEAALAAAAMDFDVYDDAIAVRDQLAAALDDCMMTATDEVYLALEALRARIIRDITRRGADLSVLADVICDADTPALVLAQRLYGDATRASDILVRNPIIRHPGFIPGGLTLRVPL